MRSEENMAAVTIGDRMRVLNPLDIKFSQQVIYPTFNDFRTIDDGVLSIKEEAVMSEKFDMLLHTTFPAITVTRWRPKLRDAQGLPVLEKDTSQQLFGEEKFFSLDNRRLYALQRACAERHPMRCGVEVFEILGGPSFSMVKKFRTRTHGETVLVGSFQGQSRDNLVESNALWDPRQMILFVEDAARNGEDLFAVTKHDCAQWVYEGDDHKTFGPFSTIQMREWWDHGALHDELPIRRWRSSGTEFTPIRKFFGSATPFRE